LTEIDNVLAVDNWQGPDVFLGPDAPARMQDRVAVIGDVRIENEAQMDEVLAWQPVRRVPRKGGRGLILNAWSATVQQGRQIHELWQEKLSAATPG
jgi:hypothetical protein